MSYTAAPVNPSDMFDCFLYFPYCTKYKYGVCTIGLLNPTADYGDDFTGLAGELTRPLVIQRYRPSSVGGLQPVYCAFNERAAPATSNVSPVTTTPSLPTSFNNDTRTEFTQSQYGSMIPIVFGSDKLAGNVFWYSGFDRDYTTDPETGDIIYYVRTSFAIGFCEGEISDIVRVWFGDEIMFDRTARTDLSGVIQPVNGEILTATVDLFSEDNPLAAIDGSSRKTVIKFFTGSEEQLPLGGMVAEEGYTLTPAYRGLSYMLIENLIVREGTIPPIFVEVISGHDTTTPRAFGTFNNTFTETDERLLVFKPEFDLVWVDAQEGPVSTGSHGFRVLNAGDLSEYDEFTLPDAELDYVGRTSFLGYSWFTNDATVVRHAQVGNQGNTGTFSAMDGLIMHYDPVPRGGAVNLDHDDSGFAALDARSFLIEGRNTNTNESLTYMMGHGVINRDVGLMAILSKGDTVMVGWGDDILPYTNSIGLPFVATAALYEENPYFADGVTESFGLAGLYVSYPTNSSDVVSITAVLPRVDEALNQFAITSVELTLLDLDLVGGKGAIHTPKLMFQDPDDANIIIYFDVDPNIGHFIKYNAFTGEIVWKTQLTAQVIGQSGPNKRAGVSRIVDSFCFIDASDRILRLDLQTGGVTILDNDMVTNQSLPSPTSSSLVWYDGVSDSLFYTSSTPGQEIARVYIGRAAGDGTAVSTITRALLERVGIYKDQLNITDIEALSVTGYTIANVKTLRSIFGELAGVLRFDIYESDGAISYLARGASSVRTIPHEDLADVGPEGWLKEHQEPDFAGARKINLTYRDYDRDYTSNVQSILLPKYITTDLDEEAAIDVSSPVVLTSNDAKKLAEILLYSKIVYSSSYEGALPIKHVDLDPADVVTLERDDGEKIVCRLREVTFGGDRSLEFQATKEDPTIYTDTATLFGNTGRFTHSLIGNYDPLVDVAWLPIPFFDRSQAEQLDKQWMYYAVLLPYKATTIIPYQMMEFIPENPARSYTLAPPSTYPTYGHASTSLNNTQAVYSTDTESQVVLKLRNTGNITPVSAASLQTIIEDDSINLCLIAGELCQFADVSVSDGVYTLTNFVRAKHGTDRFARSHDIGDRVIFLSDANGNYDSTSHLLLAAHEDPHLVDPLTHSGGPTHRLMLRGSSNNPAQFPHRTTGAPMNLVPWPVGGLTGDYDGGGDAVATWAYRDRFGQGAYADDGDEADDVINREATESYTVWWYDDPDTFNGNDPTTYLRTETVAAPTATYSAANQTTDGFDRVNDALYLLVVQNGSDINETAWITGERLRIAPTL